MKKETIKKRLAFRRETLDELYKAYTDLIKGRVKAYMIDDRQLTRFDLPVLAEEIRKLENEIEELEGQLNGGGRRKAVGIIPTSW